jgi:glycosyltransferase involved in cell wall biosynthesis
MDKANFEFVRYVTHTLGWPVTMVAHRVAAPLDTHPLVQWRRVPRPFGMHALGAPVLSRMGRRAKHEGLLIANGGNCPYAPVTWVHAVHAAWRPHVEAAPWPARTRAILQNRLARRAEAAAVDRAGLIITNSRWAKAQIVDRLGVSESSVAAVYYGNDPDEYCPPTAGERAAARQALGWQAHRLTALFIGALGHDRRKGFDLLFAAWQQLASDPAWDVDLVAVGEGADAAHWRRAAAVLAGRVRFQGFSHDVRTLLHAADLLVSPTRWEAYGLAVHEALCCGVPALVTRTAGIAERYPQTLRDLLLEDPLSVDDLVDRLREWRRTRGSIRERLAPFGEELRRRTWSDMGRDIAALLQ